MINEQRPRNYSDGWGLHNLTPRLGRPQLTINIPVHHAKMLTKRYFEELAFRWENSTVQY
jgi:hypothetical protein